MGDDAAATEQGSTASVVGCLAVLGMLLLAGVAVWLTATAGGENAVRIPAKEQPQRAVIELDEAATVTVWADLKVAHRGISYRTANDSLPHVVDVEVAFDRGGKRVATLRCNPFNSSFSRSSWGGTEDGVATREYDGRIERCAFTGDPGEYGVTVRRVPVRDDARITWKRLDVIVRY